MHSVYKSYDGTIDGPVYFRGSYDECVAYIRRQPRLRHGLAYEVMYPSGHLASYVL